MSESHDRPGLRVLVIDDDPDLRSLLQRALDKDGHQIDTVATLDEADKRLQAGGVELIVLDLDLPDGSGVAYCKKLRSRGVLCPILMLTAHKDVPNRVASLDSGADDFLGKPFAIAELRARVRALGRRGPMPLGLRAKAGDAVLDFAARRALVKGVETPLTSREWRVLELVALGQGRIVARSEILEVVWGAESRASSASLDVIIGRVRRKLGEGAIRTQRGEGYALGG